MSPSRRSCCGRGGGRVDFWKGVCKMIGETILNIAIVVACLVAVGTLAGIIIMAIRDRMYDLLAITIGAIALLAVLFAGWALMEAGI